MRPQISSNVCMAFLQSKTERTSRAARSSFWVFSKRMPAPEVQHQPGKRCLRRGGSANVVFDDGSHGIEHQRGKNGPRDEAENGEDWLILGDQYHKLNRSQNG